MESITAEPTVKSLEIMIKQLEELVISYHTRTTNKMCKLEKKFDRLCNKYYTLELKLIEKISDINDIDDRVTELEESVMI